MTDQTPVTPPPPPPPSDAAEQGGGRGRARKTVIGGVVAALVLGGGYGAYAVYDRLDGGGPQPHDVLPASSQLYLRLDLDPSAGQKVDLFRLLRKVPDLADAVGIESEDQDIRELVVSELVAPACDDIDFEDDVEPWLGDRIGVGASIKDESVVIAVQTTDEDASRAGIKKLFACADETYGIAYVDGYAILAPEQSDVDEAVAAAAKAPLSKKKQFVDDFDQLGNQGVASGWADLSAIGELPEVKDFIGPDADELAKAGSVATTLRADGSAIELAVLGGPTSGDDAPKAARLASLPADTVAALSLAGLGDQVGSAFDSFVQEFDSTFSGLTDDFDPVAATTPTETAPAEPTPTTTPDDLGLEDDFGLDESDPFGEDPFDTDPFGSPGGFSAQGLIDQIEQATGFKLPEDLATLFGDSLTLAVGAKNLETIPTLSGPDGFSALDIALALTSDQTAALDLVQRIAQLASDSGIPLVASPTDDGAVLATNQEAADAVSGSDGSLGDEAAFRSVIPDGDEAYGGLYVNLGTIIDKLLASDPPDDIREDIESASKLSAIGASSSRQDDDRSLTRLRVSFK